MKNLSLACRALSLLLIGCMLLSFSSAGADYARVETPGGPVKIRKGPSTKKSVVCQVPNHSIVEADEIGEEWSHIIYGRQSGYIMTEFLKLPDETAGVRIFLNREEVHTGDAVEVHVEAADAASLQYVLTVGKKEIKSDPVKADRVWFRARTEGLHSLQVIALDTQGNVSGTEIFIPVTESTDFAVDEQRAAEEEESRGGITVYSQRDGYWKDKRYGVSNLSDSGCAIFTLSHALQLLGYSGKEITPEQLAKDYSFCLVDGGTLNETLIGRAAKNFGFKTQPDLIKNTSEIVKRFEEGAVFTFSIVKGHIALAAGVSADGTMVRVIDSAPTVTRERLGDTADMYVENGSGGFTAVESVSEIPGYRYYFETDSAGGLCYYLPMSYIAKRGVRLIQPK